MYDNESIIIQREETFIELYDGKMEALVKHKDTDIDAYYFMVDREANTLDFNVKSIPDDKETIEISSDGDEGKINLITANTQQDTEIIRKVGT